VALVTSFAAVGLGELDPAVFDAIDGSDVNAVRADHFHVLLYACLQSGPRLSLKQLIALSGQEFELRFLVGDPLRVQLLDRTTGVCGGLLLQFGEVFPYGGYAFLDLREI
jgi:hypothetical protein